MKRSPINPLRAKPRRNEGRVVHNRIKSKAKVAPNTDEARHMARLAKMGCLVCGHPSELHHVMHMPEKARRRDHRFVVPVCAAHHRGRKGVHGLGSEDLFRAIYGIDLAAWAANEWSRTIRPPGSMSITNGEEHHEHDSYAKF